MFQIKMSVVNIFAFMRIEFPQVLLILGGDINIGTSNYITVQRVKSWYIWLPLVYIFTQDIIIIFFNLSNPGRTYLGALCLPHLISIPEFKVPFPVCAFS